MSYPGMPGARGGRPLGEGSTDHRPILRRAVLRARWELRTIAGQSPRLASILVTRSGVRVGLHTDIVIEGFPRSGSTFAVTAFLQANPEARVAHHVHIPAQLIGAARLGLPAIVLVREPEEAVLSTVIRLPHLTVRQVLRSYVRYYGPLVPYRDRLVVADLADVIADFGAVVHRVNLRFGSRFAEFDHTPADVARVLAAVDDSDRSAFPDQGQRERSRARPSELRERLKGDLRGKYRAGVLAGLRERAESLRRTLLTGH